VFQVNFKGLCFLFLLKPLHVDAIETVIDTSRKQIQPKEKVSTDSLEEQGRLNDSIENSFNSSAMIKRELQRRSKVTVCHNKRQTDEDVYETLEVGKLESKLLVRQGAKLGPCTESYCQKICKHKQCIPDYVFSQKPGCGQPACECKRNKKISSGDLNDGCPYHTVGNASGILEPKKSSCFKLNKEKGLQAGAVWATDKLDLQQPFTIEADLNFGKTFDGSDGIAFGLQTEGLDALGGLGSNLGLKGISPNFGVYFKTWGQNSDFVELAAACDDCGTGVISKTDIPFDVEDGLYHSVRLTWDPANSATFTMVLDETFTVTASNADLDILLGEAFWGFSAATGGAPPSLHKVCIRSVS
jgi:Bacterial lectin